MGSRIVLLQENSVSILMLSISVSKFHELVSVFGNEDPYRLDAPFWDKLPVNHTLKIPPDTQRYFGAELIFFNDGFGTLMGIEPLFPGVRFAIIGPFFTTCDNSPDKIYRPWDYQ